MRRLLLCSALILGSYAQPLTQLWSILPRDNHLRFPSSTVLYGADVMESLDELGRRDPVEPGVVVAHGTVGEVIGPYMVVSARLWPRPLTLVACGAAGREAPTVAFEGPAPTWRLDIGPGRPPSSARLPANAMAAPAGPSADDRQASAPSLDRLCEITP